MKKQLTTSAGAPVSNNQRSLTAGNRGPVLLQDYKLVEKLAHQNRERIQKEWYMPKDGEHLVRLR